MSSNIQQIKQQLESIGFGVTVNKLPEPEESLYVENAVVVYQMSAKTHYGFTDTTLYIEFDSEGKHIATGMEC